MIGAAIIIVALLLYAVGSQMLVKSSYQAGSFLVINLGFAYWYWLPSIQLLFDPRPDILYSTQITPQIIYSAAVLTLLYHAALVATFLLLRNLFDARPFIVQSHLSLGHLAVATAISSLLWFVVQFKDLSVDQLVGILTAQQSARQFLTYFNHSSGAAESLLSLWQIVTYSFALFVVGTAMIRRNLANFATTMAAATLLIIFLGTGTRSILLMGLTAILLGWIMRQKRQSSLLEQRIQASRFRVFYVALMAVVGVVSFYGVAARFSSNNSESAYIADSVLTNNDMMRELSFVLQNMSGYSSLDWLTDFYNFARTPINTMMPSFIGFDKDIPYHLIAFNYQRAGIDLNTGEGNVFPGVIADFYLVFGYLGPVFFTLAVIAFLLGVQKAGGALQDGGVRGGFYIASLVLLFISFRNIQGSLVMILLILAITIRLLSRASPAEPGSRLTATDGLTRPLPIPPS